MNSKTFLTDLCKDNRGATAVEYGLILALIVLAMFTALDGFATQVTGMWDDVNTKSAEAIAKSK